MYGGRDVITIASALMPNGCNVIASLPQGHHSPDTRYSILHTRTDLLPRFGGMGEIPGVGSADTFRERDAVLPAERANT